MKLVKNFVNILVFCFLSVTLLHADVINDFPVDSLEYQLLVQLEDSRLAMKSKLAKANIAPSQVKPEIKNQAETKAEVAEKSKVSKEEVKPTMVPSKPLPEIPADPLTVAKPADNSKEILAAKLAEQKSELTRYYENKLREAETSLAKRDQEIEKLKVENRKAQAEVARVKLEAKETEDRLKRDLLISITEVESLSNILEDFNRATLGEKPIDRKKEVKQASAEIRQPQPPKNVDLPVLRVAVDKANLRLGPSLNSGPLMAVAKGTRLVIEKRDGDWYQVLAPNGSRAWISSEVVEIIPDDFGEKSSVEVRGYQEEAEQRALRILRGGR